MLKYTFIFNLDDPQRTLEHAKIIKKKFFLRKLYEEWYLSFKKELDRIPDGDIVELGSGGGFIKDIIPEIKCSDIIDLPGNDITFSALEMPFKDNSIAAFFMIDTFHHIPDSAKFLTEVERTLKPGGILYMIEPANSWFGRFIYSKFHHEPFDVKGDWMIPSTGPLSGANGALPWIVFKRDREKFNQLFPDLKLQAFKYHTPTRYLVCGGLTIKQVFPNFSYYFFRLLDNSISRLFPQISMFNTIKISYSPN